MLHPDAGALVLEERAYAKINLALHVRRRRPDGYHELESLFAFAEDGDLLTAEALPDGALLLTIDGPFAAGLDCGADNLVVKAAHALKARAGQGAGAHLHLTKNLPVASGIGGGSADAAATLRLLNRVWELDLGRADLLALADPLGSDVPACLVSETLVGTGRGEALDIRPFPDLAGKPLLLINPGSALSTAPVFRGWDGIDHGPLDTSTLDAVIASGRNDLQPSAIALVPEIGEVLALLAGQPGATSARMSGSGATCFALFETHDARDQALHAIRMERPHWWFMATRIREA
jgi:4-diphosphocytidyl-2-C-methyl-D-erythritol kinase